MSLPYDPLRELIEQTRQALQPGARDVTSGAGRVASPAIPASFTDVNDDGEAVSEALFDESTWDSDEDVWA